MTSGASAYLPPDEMVAEAEGVGAAVAAWWAGLIPLFPRLTCSSSHPVSGSHRNLRALGSIVESGPARLVPFGAAHRGCVAQTEVASLESHGAVGVGISRTQVCGGMCPRPLLS